MLAIERRRLILSALDVEGSVLVSDLEKRFAVSNQTIRRDFEKLEKQGLVKKTHGGAVPAESLSAEQPYKMRTDINKAQKLIIAEKIAKLVEASENIILDASSTCVMVAKKLRKKANLTIISNSVEILAECAAFENLNLISTGGALRGSSMSLVGQGAVQSLKKFTVDKAIVSCKGLDLTKGIMESSLDEAEMKKAMVNSARQVILVADSSKFNRMAFAKSLDFKDIHCVVSDNIPGEWIEFFQENNINYL